MLDACPERPAFDVRPGRPALQMAGVVALLIAFPPCSARAQGEQVARAVRAADWPGAQASAALYSDPLAAKLVRFFRLQHMSGGTAAEIAGFLTDNPDWPNRSILLKRRDEALAHEPNDDLAVQLCRATPSVAAPTSAVTLARCAGADAARGWMNEAVSAARSAWIAGFADASDEAAFLVRWKNVLTPDDQRAKFEALLTAGDAGVASQAARLPALDEQVARARLALRGGDPGALVMVAALPAAQRQTPGLVLDQLQFLQKSNRDDEALALWLERGFAAEQVAAQRPEAFWVLRSQLARRRMREADDEGAFRLANDPTHATLEIRTDAAFLAGFIALRRLHQPELAAAQFAALGRATTAISQARAHYWLGQAAQASGDSSAAKSEYLAAAAWPTVYYGQMAAVALGGDQRALNSRILALADPAWTGQQALDFAGRELPRAAAMLVGWGEARRARPFLQQVSALSPDPVTLSMTANLALGLGLPDQAVMTARAAGRQGTLLPLAGWPLAADPPEEEAPGAVSLGIIRQESSFDAGALSPSGARGLMQMMPATARQMGGSAETLTTDPAANMRLGSAYLAHLIDEFHGALPLAIAAYNAGPSRVHEWLRQNGDPRGAGREAMTDWVEQIPFAETRNYVQRVIENIVVYRAKRNESMPFPVGP